MKTATKLLIGGGVTIAGLYLFGRHREHAALAGQSASDDLNALKAAAGKQVSAALRGERLGTYLEAPNRSLFWSAPTTVPAAYAKAAYWTAVAARVTGDTNLAGRAKNHLSKASTKSGRDPDDIAGVYSRAAATIETTVGRTNPSVRGILKVLGASGSVAAVEGRKQVTTDRSATEIARGTVEGSASDTATALTYLRGFVTGEQPSGTTPTRWFLTKWGVRIAAGGVLLLGLRLAFSSEYKAAKAAVSTAATSASNALSAVKAKVSTA